MKASFLSIEKMGKWFSLCVIFLFIISFDYNENSNSWIRINQLGYTPKGVKVAVWVSKNNDVQKYFQLIDSKTSEVVFLASAGTAFGSYGPFVQSCRLNFSSYDKPGIYYIKCGSATSTVFKINDDVYKGTANFGLHYMRQQRSGFNPFLKDSCHIHDGYTMYGPMPDSTYVNVVGGWHDASDYLQYSTTSANATWHLLAAYRDFPEVFEDKRQANGLEGKNDIPDVLDEAKWGLDWLMKMHPQPTWMFNQIADDRDHEGMRMPKEDSFYGKEFERPVYFIDGKPQQRGKFMNNTTGTSSTAAKFASSFSLGAILFDKTNPGYAKKLIEHAYSAINYALIKPGVTQTVSVRSPYIYAEENWTDDMELGFASLAKSQQYFRNKNFKNLLDSSFKYSQIEKVTPWFFRDTASHYQYYPFINLGHYELAKQLQGSKRDSISDYYKQGIEDVWTRAKKNAFYRGIPFIWCSNNLTTSFAIQCLWYRQLTGDTNFAELEQANIDWLFGCNPWGTSMVYGLPSWGDTPVDPHSAFTHIGKYPIDGGLVDGPVYTSIYKNLIGISLYNDDEYSQFQSDLAVYHDDFGDYSTNEPTMDGTASLIYLMAAKEDEAKKTITEGNSKVISYGGIIRGDTSIKKIALVFTGDEFADGGNFIDSVLQQQKVHGSFFFTGNFYRNVQFQTLIKNLKKHGNYLGSHSDRHLLYCDWAKRDSLLVNHQQFKNDLDHAYKELKQFNIHKKDAPYFLPPYEWYNDSIATWTKQMGLRLVNFSPGTRSNADYTFPEMGERYINSDTIFNSILNYEQSSTAGLNGFILLSHIGTDARRKDKFYYLLPDLIHVLKKRGYNFVKIDELLDEN